MTKMKSYNTIPAEAPAPASTHASTRRLSLAVKVALSFVVCGVLFVSGRTPHAGGAKLTGLFWDEYNGGLLNDVSDVERYGPHNQLTVDEAIEDLQGRVTGIETAAGRVSGVQTAHGTIQTKYVVNCAGQWARQLGKLAGVTVPLHSAEHFYLTTHAIDGITADTPTMRDPDSYNYYREWSGIAHDSPTTSITHRPLLQPP